MVKGTISKLGAINFSIIDCLFFNTIKILIPYGHFCKEMLNWFTRLNFNPFYIMMISRNKWSALEKCDIKQQKLFLNIVHLLRSSQILIFLEKKEYIGYAKKKEKRT